MFKVTVRCQQMDYVSRHPDKEHNCECVSLFVRGWVGVAIAPALALSVPLVLTWPDLSFYPILFDPLPSLLTIPLPRSLLPNSSPPFSATHHHPLFQSVPQYTSPAFPSFQTHISPHSSPFFSLFFFGGRLILLLQSSFIATLSLPINPLLLLSPNSLSDSPGKTC